MSKGKGKDSGEGGGGLGKWKLVRRLGDGAFSAVWAAQRVDAGESDLKKGETWAFGAGIDDTNMACRCSRCPAGSLETFTSASDLIK